MKQDISVLMDGELFEDEAEGLLDRIKRDPDTNRNWEVYHLIGDVLRQPDHIHCGLSERVRMRMQDEPTILAPRMLAARQRMRAYALSAAASLMAVGVVVWMSLQISSGPSPQMAMQQNAIRPVNLQIQSNSNDYLMAHQEFSPRAGMNAGATYIHTVNYDINENSPK